MLLVTVRRERRGDLPEPPALGLRRARRERRAGEAREPRLGAGAQRAQPRAVGKSGADSLAALDPGRPLRQLAQRELRSRGALRNDALHPDDPALPDERDLDGLGRRLRDRGARRKRDGGTRRRRRLDVDREEAREREQEDDEQDPHRDDLDSPSRARCLHGYTHAHPAGAESRDARATAPPPSAPAVRHAGRRARRGAPGAVAAVAVHRSLVSPRRVHARAARVGRRSPARREGHAHAHHAPSRERRRLPRVRRDLPRASHRRAPAAARGFGRGRRLRVRR